MRWSTFLADYDFEIIFRPGAQHTMTDVLSRRSEFELTPEDEAYVQQSQSLLKPDQFYNFATCLLRDDSLLKQIAEATTTNKFAREVKESITNTSHEPKRPNLARFTIQDNLLFRDNLLYVPEGSCRMRVLHECHDDPLVGHFGVAKTLELISQGYWWPQPWKLVKEFVKSCDSCARSKASHH